MTSINKQQPQQLLGTMYLLMAEVILIIHFNSLLTL